MKTKQSPPPTAEELAEDARKRVIRRYKSKCNKMIKEEGLRTAKLNLEYMMHNVFDPFESLSCSDMIDLFSGCIANYDDKLING